MNSFPLVLAVAVTLMSIASPAQVPTGSWDTPRPSIDTEVVDGAEYVRGEILLGIRSWEDFALLDSHASAAGDEILGGISRLRAVRIGVAPWRVDAMDACLDEYSGLAFVRYAERNAAAVLSSTAEDSSPDDPYYAMQWHLDNVGQTGGKPDADIDAPAAWLITRGSPAVIVAVIDTGIDLDSPEFDGRLLPGWDFLDEDPVPEAVTGHGVKVAGLLGANAGNAFEVAGVDHSCKILPIRVGDKSLTEFNVVQGVDYATAQGADVISMSLAFSVIPPQLLDDAIQAAAGAGCIVVAGAGNYGALGWVDETWPAASANTIAVGWTDQDDKRFVLSAAGNALDFVAPGVEVLTTSFTASGQAKLFSGSSAATPLVSGIVALMKSLNPTLTYQQLYDLLVAGAEDQLGDPLDAPGWDPWYGHGRVNAATSLKTLCGCQGGESLIASPQHASIAAGEVVALRVDAGREHAGQVYWILGSASGPGAWPFGPLTLPLAADDYSRFTLSDANGAVLVNTHGVLDADGQAMGFVMLPKGLPVASPAVLSHVAVVFDGRAVPAHAVFATNVTMTIVEP